LNDICAPHFEIWAIVAFFSGLMYIYSTSAVFTDVAVFGDTNLELPSVLSNQSAVEIHMNVAPTSLLGHISELEISADLPLHARYPVSELFKRTGRCCVITTTIIK
jgi:hypothetical protein